MPSEEIRVPNPVWSNPILEQNRFYIDIGLDLIFLMLAISPLVVLYFKRNSRSFHFVFLWLVVAVAALPFASAYTISLLPSYLEGMIQRDAGIGIVVLWISIFLAVGRIGKCNHRSWQILGLASSFLAGLAFLVVWAELGSRGKKAAPRLMCGNNLRLLFLGLYNANDAKVLELDKPPPLNDAHVKGGPEVSWRVTLLPFLELNDLYKSYDLSSPWNSDANWPIACQKVDLFTCPSESDLMSPKGGRFTSYVMLQNTNRNPDNPNLIYDQNRTLLDANRILLIESCGANVVWTEPRDADADTLRWSFKPANRKEEKEPWRSKNIGASSHYGVVQVVFGDGSTRSLSKSIDEEVLRKVILGQASDEELD
jgi:hypothetical protein